MEYCEMTKKSEIVTVADVLAMVQVSRSMLYTTLLKTLNFPRPFKIGIQRNAWFRADIEAWINIRASGVGK